MPINNVQIYKKSKDKRRKTKVFFKSENLKILKPEKMLKDV